MSGSALELLPLIAIPDVAIALIDPGVTGFDQLFVEAFAVTVEIDQGRDPAVLVPILRLDLHSLETSHHFCESNCPEPIRLIALRGVDPVEPHIHLCVALSDFQDVGVCDFNDFAGPGEGNRGE